MTDLFSAHGFIDFLFNYGLFAAKAATLILLAVLGLIVLASIFSLKQKDKEYIEIEKINDHFDAMQDALEAEILPKAEYKKMAKEKKKQEKKAAKSKEKLFKSKHKSKDKKTKELASNEHEDKEQDYTPEENEKRLFLLRFYGDMHASETDNLRETITALLLVVEPGDEAVVVLESAGGIVHNYGFAASQLQRLRDHKIKLTVAVDLIAASGGYMMACVANKIIAAPFAVIGSIGVLAQVPNFNRLLEKHDIDIEHHTAGEYKSTLTMLGKNTSSAREKFREELDDTHKLFKSFVASNRPQLNIDNIATGEHWYGAQALDLKLIDEIKTSDDYLLEKSKDTDIFEITYHVNESLKEKMQNMIMDSAAKLFDNLVYKGFNCFNRKS